MQARKLVNLFLAFIITLSVVLQPIGTVVLAEASQPAKVTVELQDDKAETKKYSKEASEQDESSEVSDKDANDKRKTDGAKNDNNGVKDKGADTDKENVSENDTSEAEEEVDADSNRKNDAKEGTADTKKETGAKKDNDESEVDEVDAVDEEEEISTTEAPEDYEITYNDSKIASQKMLLRQAKSNEKRILLVEDVDPWDTNSNEEVLSQITSYDKVTTKDFLQANLADYAVIVFANDQPFDTYENYKDFKEHMEKFAELGGVIVFGAADGGWSNGNLIEDLPGGVTKKSHYEYYNHIVDTTHPIITGSLTDGVALKDDELYEKYTSHVSFNEESFPPGTKVILRESSTDRPTLIEYPLKKGRVIASGLTWEFNYVHGGSYGFLIGYRGTYAKTAMKDLFEYAIQISDINEDGMKVLNELYLETNAHHIVVGSKKTGEVIPGAEVIVGGKKYLTDEDGRIQFKGPFEMQAVKVSKEDYRTVEQEYVTQKRKVRFIFLDEDKLDGKPYFTKVQDVGTGFDLRTQTIRVTEGDNDIHYIKVAGDWQGEKAGTFQLYQEGEKGGPSGKKMTNKKGEFIFIPGIQFNPEQPLKLKMISEDKVVSDPITLNLFIDPALDAGNGNAGGGLGNLQGFQFAEKQSGSIDDGDVTAIFPGKFSIDAPFVPIKFNKTIEENGTIKWKGAIGINSDNILKDDAKWVTYKKDVDKARETFGRVGNLQKMMHLYGSHSGAFTIDKKLWNPKLNMSGYVEITQDKNGKVIDNVGGLVVEGSNKSTYSQQFLLGPVPLYLDLTGQISLATDVGLGYSEEKEEIIYAKGKISATPKAALGGGLGVSGLATVGVEGSAAFGLQIAPYSKGDITTTADIKAELLFVGEWRHQLATKTFALWSNEPDAKVKLARALNSDGPLSDDGFSFVNRDYNEQTSSWQKASMKKARMAAKQDVEETTLQEWILPNTLPEIMTVDGKSIMLFQADDGTRETGNHTSLMYAVKDKGTWSEPAAVWESETADFFFDTLTYEDELYVVWQKSKAIIDETNVDASLAEISENSEISFAKWNKEKQEFEAQQFITDNNVLDMYATIATNGDDVTVVWVSNSENDPLGNSGTFSIMKSSLTKDGWSEPAVVHETHHSITELAAGYVNNTLQLAYTAQAKETGDSSIYLVKDEKEATKLSETLDARGLQFAAGQFYWHTDGSVVQYSVATGAKEPFGELITSSYRVVMDGNKPSFVWHDGSEVFAVVKTDDGMSDPIPLYKTDKFTIQQLAVEHLSNGAWEMVMNVKDFDNIPEKHAFIYVKTPEKFDTELNYVDANESLRDGNMQAIDFSVTNHGERQVNTLQFSVKNGGTTLAEKEIKTTINPGETVFLTEEVDLSSIKAETELDVSVYAKEEADLSNNSDTITVGLTDVALSLEHYRIDEQIIVTATVQNKSQIPANVAIKVIEDTEDGIVRDVKDIGVIDTNTDYVYIYAIDLNNVAYKDDGSKYFYFTLETLEQDMNEYDNSEMLILYKDGKKDPDDGDLEEIEVIRVTGLDLSAEKVSLHLGDAEKATFQVDAQVKPANATAQDVKWETNNASIATVNQTGLITAVSAGTATISATTFDGEFVKTVKVTVTSGDGEDGTGDDSSDGGADGDGDNSSDDNGSETGGDGDDSSDDKESETDGDGDSSSDDNGSETDEDGDSSSDDKESTTDGENAGSSGDDSKKDKDSGGSDSESGKNGLQSDDKQVSIELTDDDEEVPKKSENLPNTATNVFNYILIGILSIVAGIWARRYTTSVKY